MTAITGRAGYAVDHWLFYGKGGVAWANNKYSVTRHVPPGTPFDFEGLSMRTGWTAGAGVEWAFAEIGRRGSNTTSTISAAGRRR